MHFRLLYWRLSFCSSKRNWSKTCLTKHVFEDLSLICLATKNTVPSVHCSRTFRGAEQGRKEGTEYTGTSWRGRTKTLEWIAMNVEFLQRKCVCTGSRGFLKVTQFSDKSKDGKQKYYFIFKYVIFPFRSFLYHTTFWFVIAGTLFLRRIEVSHKRKIHLQSAIQNNQEGVY